MLQTVRCKKKVTFVTSEIKAFTLLQKNEFF